MRRSKLGTAAAVRQNKYKVSVAHLKRMNLGIVFELVLRTGSSNWIFELDPGMDLRQELQKQPFSPNVSQKATEGSLSKGMLFKFFLFDLQRKTEFTIFQFYCQNFLILLIPFCTLKQSCRTAAEKHLRRITKAFSLFAGFPK